MKDIVLGTMQINWSDAALVAFRLFVSAVMGGMIGLERGRHGRAAGLSTHLAGGFDYGNKKTLSNRNNY